MYFIQYSTKLFVGQSLARGYDDRWSTFEADEPIFQPGWYESGYSQQTSEFFTNQLVTGAEAAKYEAVEETVLADKDNVDTEAGEELGESVADTPPQPAEQETGVANQASPVTPNSDEKIRQRCPLGLDFDVIFVILRII